ncbi:uncharacterized protein LOC124289225 [Haliotis rubra]|uniref:uncharacterized protein LOC124289225 n=1 Tax=Haliotis rubra TaxID=36100 RepID=UPI001EE57B0D|nr:uncharacterized protein LOC124289225 [Haliotis rubra]
MACSRPVWYFGIIVLLCQYLVASDNAADDKLAEDEPQAPSGEDEELLPDLDEIEEDDSWNPNGVLLTDNPADWPGHLKNFGSTGRYRNVGIYKNFPKATVLFSDYVAPYIPLVMRNASTTDDAFALWKNDSYFLGLPQAITYRMPLTPAANISFKEFIQRYRKEKLVLFIAGEDQQTPIVQRSLDTMRCVYSGKQNITLVSQLDFGNKGLLHCCTDADEYGSVDVNQVDYVKYPTLREVEYHKASLSAGDCIFIPPKWYWQVNSQESSKSVDILWYHKVKHVETTECMALALEPTIAKAQFADQKSWTAARKDIALHYFSTYLVLNSSLTYGSFAAAVIKDGKLFKGMTNWTDEYDEITHELFNMLDITRDHKFSIDDLESLTPERMDKMRGHLEDRIADYEDVMKDQQLELKENQAAASQAARDDITAPLSPDSIPIMKPGEDPKEAVENYINNYLKVLEDVIQESMSELSVSGKVPDFKKKLESRQAEIEGSQPFVPTGNLPSQDSHKTAREEAKAKIKAQQGKKKSSDGEDGADEFSDTETYQVVDDSVVEEILADDEDVVQKPKSEPRPGKPTAGSGKNKGRQSKPQDGKSEKDKKSSDSRKPKTKDEKKDKAKKKGKKDEL